MCRRWDRSSTQDIQCDFKVVQISVCRISECRFFTKITFCHENRNELTKPLRAKSKKVCCIRQSDRSAVHPVWHEMFLDYCFWQQCHFDIILLRKQRSIRIFDRSSDWSNLTIPFSDGLPTNCEDASKTDRPPKELA
jgi:hypothetical protein